MSALPKEKDGFSRSYYRDELNFAEFPLASLSTALPKEQKTLEFTDEIFDKSVNKRVQRKLTITASDKYGLPTATDEEVILGLIQLSAQADFPDRRVFFTRYELLKLLGWADSARNYQRLEQSLNRWLGVTLYYEKAWWSKEEQSWVNEGFHILDHVQVLDQERQRKSSAKDSPQAGKSSFVWNEVVFASFKAGYIKQLDFPFLKSLESAISRRIYRFIDKRFYKRQQLEFDLRTFACEHIGLSKKCHNGELKRVLKSALTELETRGYLKPASVEERFVQKARGEWRIVLTRASASEAKHLDDSPLVQALIDRGLSDASAARLVAQSSSQKVEEKIALFDWLVAKGDARVQKSRAGFLYRAITEDFPLPEDYQKARGATARTTQRAPIPIRRIPASRPPEQTNTDRDAIDQFWNSLPVEEQARIESDLAQKAPLFLRQQYAEGQKERGPIFQVVRQAMIDGYVRPILSKAS